MRIVHCHVEAGAEEVLVDLSIQAWSDKGSVGGQGSLPWAQPAGAQAARQLGLKLNGAILNSIAPPSNLLYYCSQVNYSWQRPAADRGNLSMEMLMGCHKDMQGFCVCFRILASMSQCRAGYKQHWAGTQCSMDVSGRQGQYEEGSLC